MASMDIAFHIPSRWDERAYLAGNPDVARAVEQGSMPNGWHHYFTYGKGEGRRGHWLDSAPSRMTRDCRDPWNYLEITDSHGLKPCCKIPPIAHWQPGGPSIGELRDGQPFRALRKSLLTGYLGPICKQCHIRAEIPVDVDPDGPSVVPAVDHDAGPKAGPLRELRIEATTRCNLRCVYCAVSQPGYAGVDMSEEVFADVLKLADTLPRNTHIMVNGHGETTFHPNWQMLCDGLTARGFRPSIITNLARPLTAAESQSLARFVVIQISIDTADEELLAQLRRRVKLSTIVDNIARIRAAAVSLHIQPPKFALSCGVFDVTFDGLERLADFAIAHKMHSVTFWELVKYPDIPGALNTNSVSTLPAHDIARAVTCIDTALDKLQKAAVDTEVAGDFLDRWRRSGAAQLSV